MKILMVRANQGYPDPRVEKEIYSLSKEHKVELLGWDRTKSSNQIESRKILINDKNFNYHLVCLSAPQGGGFRKTFIPMLRFWHKILIFLKKNQYKYDVIHFCDFDTAALAFSIVNRKKVKIVYDIFDYYADSHSAPKLINKVIRKRENHIINNSDALILCSEKRREQIRPAVNSNTIILHNSPSKMIKLKNIDIQGDKRHTKKRLVYVGMLSNGRYLKQIARVITNHPEIEWHIGGFGELESYFKKVAENNSNIFFYGKLNYSEALFLENMSDVMTAIYNPFIPNHKFAAPNKFYEALMLGKPLIMMKNTGMDHIVSKYHLGEVISLDKGEFTPSFESALIKLIGNHNYEELKNKEQLLYSKKFSWDLMEKRLLGVYKCLN